MIFLFVPIGSVGGRVASVDARGNCFTSGMGGGVIALGAIVVERTNRQEAGSPY